MLAKLLSRSPVRRNLILQTLTPFRLYSSVLADNSNAPSQDLFLHFVTTRFNISSADAAKMLKLYPSLGRLKTLDKAEQMVSVLNRHGCNEDQIVKIIRSRPPILLTSVERVVEPKIRLLKDFGVWREDLNKIVSGLSRILGIKLEVLRSNLELLKTVLPTQDFLNRAIRNNPLILGRNLQETLKPSVVFWENLGFCGIELTKLLLLDPWVLTCSSLTPEQLDFISKVGIPRESKMYKYIVTIVAKCRIEVLEARIHNFQLCGFSPDQALQIVRTDPIVLTKSVENIKKKMDFMVNHMGFSVDFVAKRPRLFTMSLDKVMRPRFSVLQNMTAMDGAGECRATQLITTLMMTEAKFVAQIIQGHPEFAALWTVYKNATPDVPKSSKAKLFSVR